VYTMNKNKKEKLVVVDSGRSAVKVITPEGFDLLIPAVVSPAHEITMDVDLSKEDYYWLQFEGEEHFVGRLAMEQSRFAYQDRSRKKSNQNNRLMIVTAIAACVDDGDEVILLTNCPARDWATQRHELTDFLKGIYSVTHRAGLKSGQTINFTITKVYPLPEGAGAFYGYIYTPYLELVHPDLLDGSCLVIEWGDQTVNYIVVNDGEYISESCGSMDLGLHTALAEVVKWAETQGKGITIAEVASLAIKNKPLYIGSTPVDINPILQEAYQRLNNVVLDRLSGRFSFTDFRNILLAGGGAPVMVESTKQRLQTLCNIHYDMEASQWLNVKGFRVMYGLMQQEAAERCQDES